MATRRITVNLPSELLDAAQKLTRKGITETIVEGLEQIRRRRFYERALALKGKLGLNIDIDDLRGRAGVVDDAAELKGLLKRPRRRPISVEKMNEAIVRQQAKKQ